LLPPCNKLRAGPLGQSDLKASDSAIVTIVKIAAGNTVGKLGKTGSMRFLKKIASIYQINTV
jgi:hypothetical protein